jgi:excisionase family DNA binding protein
MPLRSEDSRFMSLTDVAEELSISATQVYALVRREELKALKIGGRGQWRVERAELEAYIERQYSATQNFIATHPFRETEDEPLE